MHVVWEREWGAAVERLNEEKNRPRVDTVEVEEAGVRTPLPINILGWSPVKFHANPKQASTTHYVSNGRTLSHDDRQKPIRPSRGGGKILGNHCTAVPPPKIWGVIFL